MLPERIARVRDLCAGWVKSGHTPAIVALVARHGVICLHEAFGDLRPQPDSPPLEIDSIFPIMSITKPMTATLIMCLVEDGLLGLNRPARDYLPELTGEGTEEVLVHNLLTFTAGWDEFSFIVSLLGEEPGLGLGLEGREVWREIIDRFCKLPLAQPPGQQMDYAFLSYMLLQRLVERVSGRTYDDFIQERIFTPLGMNDSYVALPESLSPRVVKRPEGVPWNLTAGAFNPVDSRESETGPNVFSTARDVAVFGQMFLNGGTYGGERILSQASVAEMTRIQTPGVPVVIGPNRHKQASYGYGWFLRSQEKWRYWDGSLQSLSEFHHQGAGGVLLWVDPRDEIVSCYFNVDLKETPELEPLWNADLFQNVVTSAVAND